MTETQRKAFQQLVQQRLKVTGLLTGLMLIIYFGFLAFVAFGKTLLLQPVVPHLPLGLALGLGCILCTWLLTGIYVRWANHQYDPQWQQLKQAVSETE